MNRSNDMVDGARYIFSFIIFASAIFSSGPQAISLSVTSSDLCQF